MPIRLIVGTREYLTSVLRVSDKFNTGVEGNGTVVTFDPPTAVVRVVLVTIDGQPDTDITVGHKARIVPLDFAGTIVKVRMYADGACELDVWKNLVANGEPTIADSIVGSNPPVLTGAGYYVDATLTGWSPNVVATDTFVVNVTSVAANVRFIQLSFEIQPI